MLASKSSLLLLVKEAVFEKVKVELLMARAPFEVKLEEPEIAAVTLLKLLELFNVKELLALITVLLMAVD